jgi:hypothetical protein
MTPVARRAMTELTIHNSGITQISNLAARSAPALVA